MRPIGVGKVVQRIVGKTIMRTVKQDLWLAVWALQLCAGQDAGCEAAVHAMTSIFAEAGTRAMIFVDDCNVFNYLNQQVTLHNTEIICPLLAPILISTY